ncbi:MAG: 1-deoxy-D-xylulose-5-phosphate reductoisomerase [Desulfamplus sp.]|nr:1-deoxy-D-xylulose-5-phosphate reductoisomerase [Desulfamplus sp.]
MKRVSILGSTGSIGRNALEVIAMHPDKFQVAALAAANSVTLLAEQIRVFNPEIAVVLNRERAEELKTILQSDILKKRVKTDIYSGDDGYNVAASYKNSDTVLLAMVGSAGLMPALAAIDAGKQIALANKETLVMAGELVMSRAAEKGVDIYPVDSEHSAIFQCIGGKINEQAVGCSDTNKEGVELNKGVGAERNNYIKKIFLTASGGPFRNTPLKKFKDIKPEHALNHPTWNMGSKITIDSATLMNKALEIVEAVRLFNVPVSDIEVLVHPQSIVHSMVGFSDGSILAQMGVPDMKAAISYALSYPERLDLKLDFPDFVSLGSLMFEKPDREKFPSLQFAVEACQEGGTLPAVMNAANEIAVNAFLNYQIGFLSIFKIIEKTMKMHKTIVDYTLDDVIAADKWAREMAVSFVETYHLLCLSEQSKILLR